MKRSLTLLVVASLVFAGVASAAVQKGDTEINLAGSFLSTDGAGASSNDSTVWAVDGFLGYFVTDNIQVGLGANGQWTDSDTNSEDDWMYGIGVAGKYHFMPTNLWVPYVGGQVKWEWSDTTTGTFDGLMYGPLAGLRFELNASNDFFVEYQYRLFAGELNDTYDSAHAVLIGIIHQFK